MCGLFGYSGKDPVDLLRLTFLAAENQERGDDATGVYGNFLAKSAKKAKDFVLLPEFRNAVHGATNIIGHTRKATVGFKIDKNAHPFEITSGKGKDGKAVVGTHNGQIFFQCLEKLQKKYDLEKTDVDSEFIYKLLVHHNFDYDKTFSELEGFMALAFIRPDLPEYLYLYHRASRPLSVGFMDGTNMYYSSESAPLELIGCQAIEPLDTDNLYVFKNGGLVEVSPVKKPQILINTVDIGLSMWMDKATSEEKAVLGISGATVNHSRVVVDHTHYNHQTHTAEQNGTGKSGTDGGRSYNFRKSKLGDIQLLRTVPIGLYTDESSIKPPKVGKYYASGNDNSCYLFAYLHRSDNTLMGLPAWYVRVLGRPDINCVSTHSGMVALEIPIGLCGAPLKLELINPLQPDVVYVTCVNKPKMGQVLEVALSVPFRCTKDEEKRSKDDEDIFSALRKSVRKDERRYGSFSTFSEFLAAVKSSEQIHENVDGAGGTDKVPGSDTKWLGPALLPSHTVRAPINPTGAVLQRSNVLESSYDPHTDILQMNYYTASINLTEVRQHVTKINKLLAEPDPDSRDLREAMNGVMNYLMSSEEYLDSRIKAYEKGEEDAVAEARDYSRWSTD